MVLAPRQVIQELADPANEGHNLTKLSDIQIQLIRGRQAGLSYSQLEKALNYSERSLRRKLADARQALDAADTSQLLALCEGLGLFDTHPAAYPSAC